MSQRKPFEPLAGYELTKEHGHTYEVADLAETNAAVAQDEAWFAAMDEAYAKKIKELTIEVLAVEQERDEARAEVLAIRSHAAEKLEQYELAWLILSTELATLKKELVERGSFDDPETFYL